MTQISRTVLRACHTVLAWLCGRDALVPSGGVESDTLSPMRTSGERIVVAGVVVRDGRVLAARRLRPAELAGGWELPGGKVEPGETDEAALVRECAEELSIDVRVLTRLGSDVAIPGGRVLRGWVVRLSPDSAEPVANADQDHDELRWLAVDELYEVDWLHADLPLVGALRAVLKGDAPAHVAEERLPGGSVAGATRVGDTVRRPAGAWTPTIHALLDHLRAAGLPGVPEPLGFDELGRDVVRFLPGETIGDGVDPEWARSDELLVQALGWMQAYHQAVRDFRPARQTWRLDPDAVGPGQIVCHNDVAPYNLVVDTSGPRPRLAGIVDWDVSGPGEPLNDVAFAAWNFVPLYDPSVPDHEVRRKLELIADAYGDYSATEILRHVPVRMAAAFQRIRSNADYGDVGMRNLVDAGHVDRNEQQLDALLERLPGLLEA